MRVPGMRVFAVAGVVSIPLIWFGVSELTAKSWLRAGDLALNSPNVIHGNKLIGVPRRVLGLYEPPMPPLSVSEGLTAGGRGREAGEDGTRPQPTERSQG